jgi:hypothetical protein
MYSWYNIKALHSAAQGLTLGRSHVAAIALKQELGEERGILCERIARWGRRRVQEVDVVCPGQYCWFDLVSHGFPSEPTRPGH